MDTDEVDEACLGCLLLMVLVVIVLFAIGFLVRYWSQIQEGFARQLGIQ